MRFLLLGCALAFVGSAVRGDDEAAKKELKALEGTWTVVAAEHDGAPLDRVVGGEMVIKENNFHVKTKSGTELKGDLVLNPTKKPKHIDYVHQDGPLKDKKWEGVYELKGATLKICYAEADSEKERPTEFKTLKNSKLLYLELQREKK
ncbi:hypothetical protein GobsT_06130 [Gemmata obscuriglobus]|uniref:TIGR03067 domain-containing protein n=1 Tax=Gemmata obscuriglobus TaxID=114 RepID=A0A2Z3HAW2_9BACT|nr:TIGR03067 domain-containing protein [Gemmata obscuriglobus]AWM40836.1 TIGR03067 domain-containing protein [Gemmata obscuriglobus]QEG25878.1 hypothetical protein GobsT_06130 [Gemmata obscuriglobus]VTR99912.1 Uncharacterized protein OS=Singulisphaera acidiphila (strain ATCC BAA-1392 / DSM 18658 / VKM B-2454 / MOB10) GN=Sinac_7035 PE=4 SV=1 [Gemmata obscuriglobus UQM 2246]